MRVLALDTTTREGSVAVVEDERVLVEERGDVARSHGERLPGDLVAALAQAGLAVNHVDLYAVASGPGSFTGLRIGIATMQGLALVSRRRLAAISALEAIAQAASRDLARGSLVAAWMDAHRHEVFSALYQVSDAPLFACGRLAEIDPPVVGAPAAVLDRWQREGRIPSVFAGDGAELYGRLAGPGRIVCVPTLAGAIGRMAVDRARTGAAVHPSAVQPLYVRRPDAELAKEQAARRTP
jgi:tRNA threonylcarbamoyladenosine biosynthesis protein TsaB